MNAGAKFFEVSQIDVSSLTLRLPSPPTQMRSSRSSNISLRFSSSDSCADVFCTRPLTIRDRDLMLALATATGWLASCMECSSRTNSAKQVRSHVYTQMSVLVHNVYM